MAIMRVARDFLINRDRDDWTMDELAKSAGVARKTLYNIYSSKQEIMLAAAFETMTEIGFATVERTDPGIASILAFSKGTTDQILQTPKFAKNIGQTALEARTKNVLTVYMLGNTTPFHAKHLAFAARAEELAPHCQPVKLAQSIAVQGWGEILFWLKGQFPLDELGPRTRHGLLSLLIGATQARRRDALIAEYTALPG